MSSDPYIVTAQLPGDIFAWADGMRRAYFPPERNKLSAHVTLFHALAPSLLPEIRRVLAGHAARHAPPRAQLTGLMDLGGGTAFAIDSPALMALRADIAEHFHGTLTAQDNHRPRLHITVQNKVQRAEAKALQAALAASFTPRAFAFTGLALHIYRGGPWEPAGEWRFRGRENGRGKEGS